MITAQREHVDKIKGMGLDTYDYLVKLFSLA